jgi:hypothetical protein
MASFEEINYALRPNKVVERKLVFEVLSTFLPAVNFSTYNYIGLGSMWFVDFIMAHKLLSIGTLISIEKKSPDRARFNAPYKCIEVKRGKSTDVLPTLDYNAPILAWMDYDEGPSPSIIDDFEQLCRASAPGSFLFMTVNAHIGSIRDQKDPEGKLLSRADAFSRSVKGFSDTALREGDLSAKKYPGVLSSTLLIVLQRFVRRRARGLAYLPICNFSYNDGAPMITIGGLLADEALERKFADIKAQPNPDYFAPTTIFEIAVPPLTHREKMAIDRLLPAAEPPQIQAELGFEIPAKQVVQYYRFYLHYPVFAEINF